MSIYGIFRVYSQGTSVVHKGDGEAVINPQVHKVDVSSAQQMESELESKESEPF